MPSKQQIDQLNQQVSQLYEEGQYEQALEIARQACDLARQHFSEDDAPRLRGDQLATCLNNLAWLYYTLGNYTAAEPLYRQALEIRRQSLGEEHPAFGRSLNDLGVLYFAMGNYSAAEPLYRQALQIRRQSLGKEHPDVAESLHNLAVLYESTGSYAEAEDLFQQALIIRRVTLGETDPEFATTLDTLAGLYESQGNYPAAQALFQQALEIRRTALGEEHPDVAISLSNLAGLYQEMGNYTQAELFYRQALEIERTALGESHPNFAIGLGHLAVLYEAMGNYTAAEESLQQALEIERTLLGQDHPDVANTLNNLARLYDSMGNYRDAERLYRQALESRRTALGEEHPDVADTLDNLAVLYDSMGNYRDAESLYRQALESRRTVLGESHPRLASSLNNLAGLYESMGSYAAAESLYQQALEILRLTLGEQHPHFASSLNNLALLYQVMGKDKDAHALCQQASSITRTTLGEKHPAFASNLNQLAVLYESMENYTAAESLYRKQMEIERQALGEDHPEFATTLNNLAELYKAMGNYAQAEPLYQQALTITRSVGEKHPDLASSLNNLADLYVATGRVSEAMTLTEQAEAIYDWMIGQVFSIGSERQRMAYLETLQGNLNAFLSIVYHHFVHSPAAVCKALDFVCRRKAIGIEALAAQRDAVLGGRYPALQAKLRQLTILRMQIAQKSLAGPGKEGIETHQQLLAAFNEQKEELEAELARQIPEMNLEQKLQVADRHAVARMLPEGAALVEFVRFDLFDFKALPARGETRFQPARYLAFILHAGKPDDVQMIDLGEAEPIEQMITMFRRSITGQSDNREARHGRRYSPQQETGTSDGTALRATLFDPLLKALGDCKRLFLAPDGDLNRLPFEILPTSEGNRLIDDYQISYLSVGRDVLRLSVTSRDAPTPPLVAADPDFDLAVLGTTTTVTTQGGRHSRDLDSRSLHFNRLDGTRREGKEIAQMLKVEPLLEQAALESAIKGHQSPSILHIATHGFFLPDQKPDPNVEKVALESESGIRLSGAGLENPLLRSGLALAGANTWLKGETLPAEAEDGILTAEDVSGLDLLATELVVLSACETGLGEVQVGEGVFGLRRAFMLAGAKTLIMSLWKVPDLQTQELMSDFYRRILTGEPRADALRNAQLAMKAKSPDPYYWGAFICQGDPSPLPSDSHFATR